MFLLACPFGLVGEALGGEASLREFFGQHCIQCHGPDKQKGDLRFDTLEEPTLEGETGETWKRVVAMLSAGDMPPKKELRPATAVVDGIVRRISDALAQSASRPIALRRLNRTEYEHTVQDLLGIDTPLKELLPADASVQGFDNVTDGLSISSILMERYLEAADVAFESVIRRIQPLPPATRRLRVMEQQENIESVNKKKGGVIEAEGSFVKFTPGWPPVRIDPVHPIEDGVYRCRLAVWPHEPGDRTLAVAIYVGPLFGPGKRRFMGMFDVTGSPGNPRIVEFETFFKDGHTMHIVPWIYPEHVTWRDKEKEARPGIGVAWAETHGPLDQSFPSEAQRQLFGTSETLSMEPGRPFWMRHRKGVKLHNVASSQPRVDAERIIRQLVPRAFRRPVAAAEADPFVKLALGRLEEGRTFEEAVRAGVAAVLCAPQFLLLNRERQVDDYTLASRLSYFLWSSMPDETLLALAAEGKLQEREIRRQQVERMLKDERVERFISNFTGQWLGQRDIEFTSPDRVLYPEFDPLLQESMLGETREFFRHVLEKDLSIMTFVDSEFTFLNERLARHYGMEGIEGHERFRRVALPEESLRGGVLAQASVLKVTANGTTTSPVLRGVWVLDHLLGQPAPPPPAGIPAFEPDIRGATSIRDQLARHRENESCARCHRRIDPPGFALEEFNAIGGHRTWYRSLGKGKRVRDVRYTIGPEIDPSGESPDGESPDGESFGGFREYRAQLLKQRKVVARAIARKLLVYGTGRPLTAADQAVVDDVVAAVEKDGLGFRSMIHAVVESEWFQSP